MYTISKSARIVLALLKKHGIRQIVINPGTTNMPIIRGVQNDPFFKCYSVVDERSAMYFAIGLYLQTGEIVATTCTSAQATRNYIPGLTEAFYKHAPILAITTSKHPKHLYQEYMQGPDQTSLPNDSVKKSFSLPYISNSYDEKYCERMVNEAILELTHRVPGPVQLNLAMIDNELGQFTEPILPIVKTINRYMYWDEWNVDLKNKKIMIVIGEHRPFTVKQKNSIESFCHSFNTFIYTNHLSNYIGEYSLDANLALTTISNTLFLSKYKPDILITIGGQTGDYPLFGILSAGTYQDFEHWRVSPDGKVIDTYDKLTKIFECPEELFFDRLSKKEEISTHAYYKQWEILQESKTIPIELPFSNAYVAQQIYSNLPNNSYLNLAILNSLRIWNYFPIDKSITCYSNVAAFGIDGCMSLFLGESVATDKLCFLVIGDLAFFYDMNSLGIKHLKNNIRILLVNNGIGIEFKNYTHPAYKFGDESNQYIAAEGHNGRAKGWAENMGFKYLTANSKEEFAENKEEFIKESDQPILFEIFTTEREESEALKLIIESNSSKSLKEKIVHIIKPIVGEKNLELVKKIRRK